MTENSSSTSREACEIRRTCSGDDPDRKHCWVCFATEDDDRQAAWVRPCRCRGTTKWVHQQCLQRWIDEKQKGNANSPVSCPQCSTEYIIIYPKLGSTVYVLDLVDRLVYKVCPFVAAGLVVGSIYWTAVTYGAVTVMQVLGHKEGLNVMEQADPLFLLIGLPTIPITLILGKMIRWEDYVLRVWRKHSPHLPLLGHLFPEGAYRVLAPPDDIPAFSGPLSATRVMCGAMILPTVATICGKMMFNSVQSNLQRTILGGIAFIVLKGAIKLYFKQQNYYRRLNRCIVDFDEGVALRQQQQQQEDEDEDDEAVELLQEVASVGAGESEASISVSESDDNEAAA
ncbi:PREDICTED: E3 ubiquitin-protein ligase MARCH5-like [Priapulus caudatus]|uniref:E3 ubiquitin-protein ligase MARCHF5 n=1 Tax=Priapulus caudatus TaxID=37621 RepID=A0ABM1F8C3_PRICU|nr:PREDICTED: E3 ubiquitin-protein ligase MARCH5-like [Priapulus caudatus]